MCCAFAAVVLSLLAGPQAVCGALRRRSPRVRAAAALLLLLVAAAGGSALAAQYLGAARADGAKPWAGFCIGAGARGVGSRS